METELKFQVPRGRGAALQRAIGKDGSRTTRLQAVYADTADRRLAANQMALRMRKEGRVWVQTLKGRGDGLMQRLEHEVVLPPQRGTPALDVRRHAGSAVGMRLIALLEGAVLLPLYSTDISRLHKLLHVDDAQIEVAHDRGWLIAGQGADLRRLAVNEVEFELKQGPAHALPAFATTWLSPHRLLWDCRTKSERGMRLAMGIERVSAVPAAAHPRVNGVTSWQAALRAGLAHALPNAAEIAEGLGSEAHQRELLAALRELAAVLRKPHAGASRQAARCLADQLRDSLSQPELSVDSLRFQVLLLAVLMLSLPTAQGPG